MKGNTQNIIHQIFKVGSLEAVSVQQLEQLVEQYPSFGAGHYLLCKKLKLEGDFAYTRQAQKAALYFTNPFWLQWLLSYGQDKKTGELQAETAGVAQPLPEPAGALTAPTSQDHHQEQDMMDQIGKKAQQQAVNATLEIKEEALAFEPYHTIDYFASQGIKFVQETNPDDKLGKQLKSFTEWLKMMKRLPRISSEQDLQKDSDETIQQDAAHSIERREIVTEAMAEVLIKQGKLENAEEVYRKLSLLNPDKSLYFALRIEQLKE